MPVGSKLLTLLSSSFHLRHFAVPSLPRYYGHPSFAFSSAAISDVRHYFAFSRTKPVFWRRVASHVHTEAAVKEVCAEALTTSPRSSNSHPWPEWLKLAGFLGEKDYSDRWISSGEDDDSLSEDKDLDEEFLKDVRACLGFARARPDILRLLTKKSIEAVVLNGSPFLFKNGENSARRMKIFFSGDGGGELELEKAQTIDIIRYLLSYVYGPSSSSDVNGLKSNELVESSVRKLLDELFNLSGTVWKSKSVDSTLTEVPSSNEQFWPPGQYTEMRSSNFAYPKSPGQISVALESQSSVSCNLIDTDYGKSIACQKQGHMESPSESCSGIQASSTFKAYSALSPTNSSQQLNHLGNNYSHTYHGEYIGKPNSPSGSLWTDNGTPYTGSTVNSSTRSHQLTSDGRHSMNSIPPHSNSPNNNYSNIHYGGPTASSTPSPDNMLNTIQPSSSPLWSNNNAFYGGTTMNSSHPPREPSSNYYTSYMRNTAKSTQPSNNSWDNDRGYIQDSAQPFVNSSNSRNTSYVSSKENSPHPLPESWNKYTTYGAVNTKSTEPSINSCSNSNTYFGEPISNPSQVPSNSWSCYATPNIQNNSYSYAGETADPNRGYTANSVHSSSNSWNSNGTSYSKAAANPAPACDRNSWNSSRENWGGGFHRANSGTEGLSVQAQTQNTHDSGRYSGKSLEGSCVKEPDPLDMSEEAKAERWFRRAAQIKDISELSQIPDEDFPQIMPMRKGVNRFVVSKRKTPLERRLASQEYKRNFPVVSSEAEKEPTVGEIIPSHCSDSGL